MGLVAQFGVGIGTVNGFVATAAPASAALDIAQMATRRSHGRVTGSTAAVGVALDAQGLVAFGEHLLVHRAVGVVAGGATFADGVVSEDEGTGLGLVALEAGFVFAGELRTDTLDGIAGVRVMAVTAGHLAGEHGVTVGQHELCLFIEVALEAGLRGFLGIDDGARAAAGFDVFAARAVAGFATHIDGVITLGLELRMISRAEVADEFLMAGGTFLGADESGARDAGRSHHRAARGAAGYQNQRHRGTGTCTPQEAGLFFTNPSAEGRCKRKCPEGLHGNVCYGVGVLGIGWAAVGRDAGG